MAGLVLAIDCGTQSLRSVIFDSKGNTLGYEKVAFEPYFQTKPEFAEQEPHVFYEAMCTAIKALKAQVPTIFEQVDTIAITTQRDNCILVDQQGNPLRPMISWADERLAKHKRSFTKINTLMLKTVRMYRLAQFLGLQCKGHWVQDYEPEIWAKTYKYLQLSGYLNFKLTGIFNDGVASQVGHIPFDYKKRQWERPTSMKGQIFQLGKEKMVDLVETGGVLGHVTEAAAQATGLKKGLQVIAAGSDKGCETLGVGCDDNETIALSLGSQATVQTGADRYYEVLSFIPPFPGVNPARYNPEITIYRGYWMIAWFKKEMAKYEVLEAKAKGVSPESILDQALSSIPAGSEGLMLQPFWGAGLKNPEARGSIIGFSDYHNRYHIYRAIIEGIGFALLEGMHRIEKKSGHTMQQVMISGGGSGSDTIAQITADIFNLPVYRVQTSETSALGAAMVGYIANGTYETFEAVKKAMVHKGPAFMPEPEAVQVYDKLYSQVYTKIYKRLKPFYDFILKMD